MTQNTQNKASVSLGHHRIYTLRIMRMTNSKINGILTYLGSSFNSEEFSVRAKITCKYMFCSLRQCLNKKEIPQIQQCWVFDTFVSCPLVRMLFLSPCFFFPLSVVILAHMRACMYAGDVCILVEVGAPQESLLIRSYHA